MNEFRVLRCKTQGCNRQIENKNKDLQRNPRQLCKPCQHSVMDYRVWRVKYPNQSPVNYLGSGR